MKLSNTSEVGMLEEIAYHSVDTTLLSGLPVLDVGCRDFAFANAMAARKHRVIALDPDPTVESSDLCFQKNVRIEYYQFALVRDGAHGPNMAAEVSLVFHPNPEARYTFTLPPGCRGTEAELIESKRENPNQYLEKPVVGFSLGRLMYMLQVSHWDVVKLNCEGAETEILESWPGPVSNQVVVSFHEHFRPIGLDAIEKIMQHMDRWYLRTRHVLDARYGGGMNYWDTVLTLKKEFGHGS